MARCPSCGEACRIDDPQESFSLYDMLPYGSPQDLSPTMPRVLTCSKCGKKFKVRQERTT